MSASLDRVLQPDGSYKWQLVELREAQPEAAKPVRKTRKAKAEEPAEAPETTETPEIES